MKKHIYSVITFSLIISPGCSNSNDKKIREKPNIILIVADDLGYADLGCQGSSDIRTPNIDKLASSGIRFTAGYVPSSVCGPSRASLMTGNYSASFGIQGNADAEIGLPIDQKNIAEYLNPAGYSTKVIGKWHLGHSAEQTPMARGFDEFFGFLGGSSNYFPFSKSGYNWNETRSKTATQRNDQVLGVGDLPPETYLTDIFTDEAVRFIEAKTENPFFIYLAYNAPHGPIMAPESYLNRNDHIKDSRRKTFAGMMTALDDGVGKIMAALNQNGLSNNTLVIFLSDNGGPTHINTSLNTPFRGQKGDVWEGGVRIPFMLAWPDVISSGQIFSEPIFSLDILPTLLAAAEIESTDSFDGINLLPWLAEGKTEGYPHDDLLFWRAGKRAIRSGELKLSNTQLGPKSELFNILENYQENSDQQLDMPEVKQMFIQKVKNWESGWENKLSFDNNDMDE